MELEFRTLTSVDLICIAAFWYLLYWGIKKFFITKEVKTVAVVVLEESPCDNPRAHLPEDFFD